MSIDFTIVDGARGGLTFEFTPTRDNAYDHARYFRDRRGLDVFSVREDAFVFIEGAIVGAFPEWINGYHHGVCYLPKSTWLKIFANLSTLRFDIRSGMLPNDLVKKHMRYGPRFCHRNRLHRKALLDFLEGVEERINDMLTRYPYVVIGGI